MTEASRVKIWNERISSAKKTYSSWSDEFDVPRLEKYYRGKQWRGTPEEDARQRYVINLVYSSLEVNKPSLVFHNPRVRMQPRPGRDDPNSNIEARARLCEDTVQSIIDDPDVEFMSETSLALHEAHFAFGIIEVGYTADWIDNPDAGKPVLKEDGETPLRDSDGADVLHPDKVLRNGSKEQIYIKRIPAHTFLVSMSNKNSLKRNDWAGYYEWHYVEDIKRNPLYKNTGGIKATGVIADDFRPSSLDKDDVDKKHGMVKLWKIWDFRTMTRMVIADGHNKVLLEEPFSFCPFAVLKFHEILDSFYPMPPVSQWLMPQDEINETRESQRAHRRRFYRRYTALRGSITDEELDKLETGGDGVVAFIEIPNGIAPLQDAPMGSDVWQNLDVSKLDYLGVTGIGGDQRGVAESETATQASIIDQRSRIRESAARTRVSDWLAQIARLMLLTVREKMQLPFWVTRNADPNNPQAQLEVATTWSEITSEDLGSTDMDVFIELSSMSPIAEEAQRLAWNQVLALLTNPQLLMILASSEIILRKTMALYGVKSEREIREIQNVAQQIILAQQQAQLLAAGATGPGAGAGTEASVVRTTDDGSIQEPPEIGMTDSNALTSGGQ